MHRSSAPVQLLVFRRIMSKPQHHVAFKVMLNSDDPSAINVIVSFQEYALPMILSGNKLQDMIRYDRNVCKLGRPIKSKLWSVHMTEAEKNQQAFEEHKHRRDEQFWFTAAVTGFNGILLTSAEVPPLSLYAIIATVVAVTLFGSYLVLNRWMVGAGRSPTHPPDSKSATALARLLYSLREMKASFRSLPYVIAEFSGTLFYLLVMVLGAAGVFFKNWSNL